MPKSFSEDGALGAWGGDGSSAPPSNSSAAPGNSSTPSPGPAPEQQTGGFSQSDFDNYSQNMFGNADGQPTPGTYKTGGGKAPSFTPYTAAQEQGALDYAKNMFGTPDGQPTPGTYTTGPNGFGFKAAGNPANPTSMIGQGPQNTGGFNRVAGFSQGGPIPDDINGSPEQDAIQKALSSVDQVLAFGRKLHGLGGGDNEGAIQTAARMPSVPGSQSESGRPPVQPMPGPLPPTSNPFGKRADAGDTDNDGDDDSAGAIDTDEDAA